MSYAALFDILLGLSIFRYLGCVSLFSMLKMKLGLAYHQVCSKYTKFLSKGIAMRSVFIQWMYANT